MKRIHILESTLRYLLDEGRNAEKAKQKTIAVMKNYLSQNGVQGEQLEAMAMEYENSLKEWLFHANMPDSIIRLEPIMANVAMQLDFTPKNRDTEELYRLKDITNYIIANYKKDDFPIALNKLTLDNTSFDSLNELFGSAMDKSKGSWKPSDNGKPKPHYTVKRLDTFEEARMYHRYTQNICYLGGKETWNDYTSKGKNAVYVLLRDGWEDIPAEHDANTPYDDYGESMVFVIIRPDGKVAYSNTRWNHNTNGKGPIDVDQSFTENMKKVSDMLQTDYRNVLKPYTEEELLGREGIKLSTLRKWISEGKDILQLCEHEEFTDKLYKCYLSEDRFVIYNHETKEITPSYGIVLSYVYPFNYSVAWIVQDNDESYAIINTDGEQISDWLDDINDIDDFILYKDIYGKQKLLAKIYNFEGLETFIDINGKQICDWYDEVSYFINGYAKIYDDKLGYSFINTDGKRICGWYEEAENFHDGVAIVQPIGYDYMTLIDITGSEFGCKFQDIYSFKDGFMAQLLDDKWVFINKQGQQIGGKYDKINDFHDGLASVQRGDGNWSFINTKGQQICGWYDRVNNFHNGFCTVVKGLHRYYMDTNGNLYDFDTMKPISSQNESYLRLNNLIAETLQKSIRNYLLYN